MKLVAPINVSGRRLGEWKQPRSCAHDHYLAPSLEVTWIRPEIASEGKASALVTDEGQIIPIAPSALNLFTCDRLVAHIIMGTP